MTGVTVSVLGRYEAGDQPAMVAFEHGKGRVFIIGVWCLRRQRLRWRATRGMRWTGEIS